MQKIAPVILAAGRGERLTVCSPKPMASVDGVTPVIGNVLGELLRMGYVTSDIGIVLGYKREKIENYIGAGYKKAIQKTIGNAVNGLAEWANEHGYDRDVLALYSDDGFWCKKDLLQQTIQLHERSESFATLLCTSLPDRDTHRHAFITNAASSRVNEVSEGVPLHSTNIGYAVGAFCLSQTCLNQLTESNEGIVTFLSKYYASHRVSVYINDFPYKSINTNHGLYSARTQII